MLRALAEHGIAPDPVVGTSVGSLNGAVMAETGDVARAEARPPGKTSSRVRRLIDRTLTARRRRRRRSRRPGAGDVCHLDAVPRPIPDGMLLATHTALRQRVLIEAPLLATRVPILHLPRPCARNRSPLDVDTSDELIDPAHTRASRFLSQTAPPQTGRMAGTPQADPRSRRTGPHPTILRALVHRVLEEVSPRRPVVAEVHADVHDDHVQLRVDDEGQDRPGGGASFRVRLPYAPTRGTAPVAERVARL